MKYILLVLLLVLLAMQSDTLIGSQMVVSFNSFLDTSACKLGLLDSYQCTIIDFNNTVKDALK